MADSILESLLGEVKSNFNGGIDVAELVSRATVAPRIEVSPPRLIIGGNEEEATPRKKDKKKSKKDKKDRSKDEKRHKHRSKSRDRDRGKDKDKSSKSKDTTENRPWTIEPIKKMYNPVLDDLPLGADFQSVQPPSDPKRSFRHAPTADEPDPRRDVTKDGLPESRSEKKDKKDKDRSHRSKKDKKEKKHRKKDKKKSKKDEEDAVKELQPRALAIKLLPETQAKVEEKRRELEEGEIVDDNTHGGWMSLDPEKSSKLENADEYLAKRLERKKQKEEKEGKKKSKKDDKDRHKDDKDRHKDDKDHRKDDKDRRDRHLSVSRHRDRNEPYPKASGSLSRPLSPRRNASDQSKILPASWSKHINTLLKPSNEEFSRSDDRRHKDYDRDRERTASRASHRDRDRDHDRRRDDHRHIEREIPRRQPRSRSASPVAGRGRNFFRRTDAEWREHQRERIQQRRRRRNMSPVRIFESDYTDRHGHIDKRKLMDIATRNVTKLAMSGAMPKGYQLLSTIKNKSVKELVDLCTQLHNEDERARYDRPSSESEPEDDRLEAREWEYDNTFSVRGVRDFGASLPSPTTVGFLEDGMPFQLTTDTRTNESILRMSYPVSSGIEHREKELEPLEDDIPEMPLVTALAKIKTNIPTPFIDCTESQFIGPIKPVGMPSLPPLPKPFALTSSVASTSTTNAASTSSNLGPITLDKPIEINIPTTTADSSAIVTPVVPQKPIVVRASFLRSGKKAAEEVMKKLMPPPEMVPPPSSTATASVISPVLQDLARPPVLNEQMPPPMIVPVVESAPPIAASESASSVPKDVTHSDALSAILDRVDQLINTGNIEKLAVVEKKVPSPEAAPAEEPITGDFVKIPERTKEPPPPEKETEGDEESKKKKEHKKKSKKEKKADKDNNNKDAEGNEDGEEKKKKKRSEEDEKKREERKRKKQEAKSKGEPSPKKAKPGEMLAIMPPPPPPPPTKVEFDMRDPSPYVKALTSAQLAIEAPPSLKAEWRDPRNPLVSILNDPNVPLPYRIIAPKREPIVKPEDMVFKMPAAITAPPRAINDLVQRRAQLTVALASDPNDRYMRRKIEEIDRDMSAWAESKNIPGRFTGRTGARILSADELAPSDPRYNAWARKDLFINAPEHESVFGRRILEGMGWQQGTGLGRSLQGPQEPLKLDVKCDRKGLYAPSEAGRKREMIADIDGKNPISLVMEYCARARLQPPTFTCIESGPNNSRRFLWKCTIDGVEYEPAMASGNKKAGKTQVCYVVLQALGLVPPTVPNS